MSVACAIIAGGSRAALLDLTIIPSARSLGFDEVLVVGEHHPGEGYRYHHVPALTWTTVDALVKRDVAALSAESDWLFYLTDDHAVRQIGLLPESWLEIGVPARFCQRNGDHIPLNMGLDPEDPNHPYCGGHAGLYSRQLIRYMPWTTQPHHPSWDLLASQAFVRNGAGLESRPDWVIEDVEPGATPWH